jgi:UDP-galactopyranose mutase
VNYPQDEHYTRVTEYKHLTGQAHSKTSLTFEYPAETGDPYYPIPQVEQQQRFKAYERLANELTRVRFIGRLATYRYYNMDQVVGQALASFNRIVAEPSVMEDYGTSRRAALAESRVQP